MAAVLPLWTRGRSGVLLPSFIDSIPPEQRVALVQRPYFSTATGEPPEAKRTSLVGDPEQDEKRPALNQGERLLRRHHDAIRDRLVSVHAELLESGPHGEVFASTPNHKSAEHKSAQHKSAQHKSAQHKSAQHKSAQHKSAQHKSAQHKSAEHKSAQHKSAQHKSAQHKSAEHKSAQHKSAQHKSAEHKSAEHKSAEHKSAEHKSAEHKSAEHKSAEHKSAEHKGSGVSEESVPPSNSIFYSLDLCSVCELHKLVPHTPGTPAFYLHESACKTNDVFGRLVTNSSGETVTLDVMGARFSIPKGSSFLLSDAAHLEPLVEHCTTSPTNCYDVVVLDPPWWNRSVKRARKYSYLTMKEVSQLPLPSILVDGALVIMWATNKRTLVEGIKASLFKEWCVQIVAEWQWLKVTTSGEMVIDLDSVHRKPYETLVVGIHKKCLSMPECKRGAAGGGASGLLFNVLQQLVVCSVPTVHSQKPFLGAVIDQCLAGDKKCKEQSRHDDMESLGYAHAHVFSTRAPCPSKASRQRPRSRSIYKKISEKKMQMVPHCSLWRVHDTFAYDEGLSPFRFDTVVCGVFRIHLHMKRDSLPLDSTCPIHRVQRTDRDSTTLYPCVPMEAPQCQPTLAAGQWAPAAWCDTTNPPPEQ